MTVNRKQESRTAFIIALQVANNNVGVIDGSTEETVTHGIVGINLPEIEGCDDWTYIYNAVQVPSCCAGLCLDYKVETVGYVSVTAPSGQTYSMSIETLTHYEWDI